MALSDSDLPSRSKEHLKEFKQLEEQGSAVTPEDMPLTQQPKAIAMSLFVGFTTPVSAVQPQEPGQILSALVFST